MKGKATASKTMSLDNVLDFNAASGLQARLLALRGSNVSIDGSAVDKVGTLCIQVLMAARKTWDEDKLSLTFSGMSDALANTMQLSGINYDHMLAKESN